MAYTHTHVHLKAHGSFGDTTSELDHWSAGMRIVVFGPSQAPPEPPYTSFLAAIQTAVQVWHSTGSKAGQSCYLRKLTAARIGTDGFYEPKTSLTTEYVYPSPISGGATNSQPWSSALVTSLRTSKPRGVASNGRIYWPLGAVTSSDFGTNTGRLSSAFITTYVTAMKTLLDKINLEAVNSFGSGARIAVLSKGGQKEPPTSLPVTSIRVDGRIDAQERRENDQPSTYATALIPGSA